MERTAILEAARLLVAARRGGPRPAALPPELRPASFADAAAIQAATLGLLGEDAAGYKVAGTRPEESLWGAILTSRLRPSPARFAVAEVPLLGVEPEIAYRLETEVTGSAG